MTGEVGEAIRSSRPPPPFHERVLETTRAGDLTQGVPRLKRDLRFTVAGQCRSFTDFAAFGHIEL